MKYRVWVKDIALQSIVVEAENEVNARKLAEKQAEEGDLAFEDGLMDQSAWEVESVEPITE